ncbi:MAG: Bug family tripartite tricarboxylate transporter substrate binding protein, partial [Burkholderiales bacterium]
MNRHLLKLGTIILFGTAFGSAHAQSPTSQAYPNKPVRLVVPFPPGGPVDVMARTLAQKLGDEWKQPMVVENRSGGNSAVGAIAVARSAPDGYTLLIAMDSTLIYNPITVSNLS